MAQHISAAVLLVITVILVSCPDDSSSLSFLSVSQKTSACVDGVRKVPHPRNKFMRVFEACTPYNATYPLTQPQVVTTGGETEVRFKIAVIADLDKASKDPPPAKNSWHSFLLEGVLTLNKKKETVSIVWDDDDRETLTSSIATGGKGMELSELQVFDGKLFSCGDKTGIVYQVHPDLKKDKPIPWVILDDGNGIAPTGFKGEWMTVKQEKLYVGSTGNDRTDKNGTLISSDNQWIKIVNNEGIVTHVDWRNQYQAMRKAAGTLTPGYMNHESAVWSSIHNKWFFLPRKASLTPFKYDEDGIKGTNILISADESFSQVKVTKVGELEPKLGYSSFKFIPGTGDRLIVAIKSMEVDDETATFVTVFTIDGKVVLPDQAVGKEGVKYEGIEFI